MSNKRQMSIKFRTSIQWNSIQLFKNNNVTFCVLTGNTQAISEKQEYFIQYNMITFYKYLQIFVFIYVYLCIYLKFWINKIELYLWLIDTKYFLFILKEKEYGIPWWFSGWNSVVPTQGTQVQSPVRELDPTYCNYKIHKLQVRPGTAK